MNMPTLLIVDTSSRSTVLGLSIRETIIDRTTPAVNSHSREILPALSALLADAGINLPDIDALVFGQGPGSFTGLRIAAGVVQGLAYGLGRPVVQVSTMAALAQSLGDEARSSDDAVCVALSARLEEVYFGAYRFDAGLAVPVTDERVADVRDLPSLSSGPSGRWRLIGDTTPELAAKIAESTGVTFEDETELATPRIQDLAALGRQRLDAGHTVNALHVAPVYLREEVASRPGAPV